MFGLLRLLFLLIIVAYGFCWWQSKRRPNVEYWLRLRRAIARCGLIFAILIFIPLILHRFGL